MDDDDDIFIIEDEVLFVDENDEICLDPDHADCMEMLTNGVVAPMTGAVIPFGGSREDLEWFVTALSERFIGRKVKHLTEVRNKHLGDGDKEVFSITVPTYFAGPACLEVFSTLGIGDDPLAANENARGEPKEAEWGEFAGKRTLDAGLIVGSMGGFPITCEVEGLHNRVLFGFTYLKSNNAALTKLLVPLKAKMLSGEWFRGRKTTFSRGELELASPAPATFEELVLDSKLLEAIKNNTTHYLHSMADIIKAGAVPRRGVLLSGAPGTGKTMCSRAISCGVPEGTTTIWVTGGGIREAEHVKDLFTIARALTPALLIFEDIDALGLSRETVGHTTSLLGELLSQMDGVGDTNGLVIIATTNHPEVIDSALKDRPRRFDRHYKFTLPSQTERVELLRRSLPSGIYSTDELDKLARRMSNASAAAIWEVAQTAKVNSARKKESLAFHHLMEAADEVAKYEEGLVSSPSVI